VSGVCVGHTASNIYAIICANRLGSFSRFSRFRFHEASDCRRLALAPTIPLSQMQPHAAFEHPGVAIAHEIEARGWIQSDLAFILGLASSTISNLVSGRKAISAADSIALAEAFGCPPDYFLNLQVEYDLHRANAPSSVVQQRAMIQREYPLREMIKRGWIEEATPRSPDLEARVARFFGVGKVEDIPHVSHAARKSDYSKEDTKPTQLAWLYRVRQIAREMVVPRYSEQALRNTAEAMQGLLAAPEGIRHIPHLLAECGVRFVVVEGLPGGSIDGVCLWLDGQSPVIGMSLRYDRIDNFWFVLRHEIEHVLNGDGLLAAIIDENVSPSIEGLPKEEILANQAATDFCVPASKMDSFFHRKNPFFSRRDVLVFADRIKVHPGLVVGQLQFRLGKFSLLRDLQVKVRDIVTASMPVDGWGDVIPVET